MMILSTQPWLTIKDGDPRARPLFDRYHSRRRYKGRSHYSKFIGPGEHMVLMTANSDALFVWRKFIDRSGQQGVNCAVFRNESPIMSSFLIKCAVELAQQRWPGQRLYTYINPRKIESINPGYCFKAAGWRQCGQTKGRLTILELQP